MRQIITLLAFAVLVCASGKAVAAAPETRTEVMATATTPEKILCHIKKTGRRIRFYGFQRTDAGWQKVGLGHVSCSIIGGAKKCRRKVEAAIRELVEQEGWVLVLTPDEIRSGVDKCPRVAR